MNKTINLTMKDWGFIENIPVEVDEENRIQGKFVNSLFGLDYNILFTIENDILYTDAYAVTDVDCEHPVEIVYRPFEFSYSFV